MLKNRVITASILAPLIIAAIIFLPPGGFAVLWGFIILLAAWEWGGLAGLARKGQIGFAASILVVMVSAHYFAIYWAPGELPVWFYAIAVVWWLIWAMAFRRAPQKLVKFRYPLAAKLFAGTFVLLTGWALMAWLRFNFSEYQVLYLALLIWVADIAAYFTGKNWGITKLLPEISPGKTVEGVYGAIFAAILMALAVGFASHFETQTMLDFVFLSIFTVAFSVSGDLFESLAKRVRGVKDSGTLLPGHGGVLDRIDSLLAAVAIFYAGSLLIPIFIQLTPVTATEIVMQPDSALEAPGQEGDDPMAVEPEEEQGAADQHDDHHDHAGHTHTHDHDEEPSK
jgi:phosphatidate cytidylyltransferase